MPARIATAKSTTSPRFAESRKATNFVMFVVDPSSLANGGDDRSQLVVREDDVGGLAGCLRARPAHRDSHVRTTERGCVVDSVPGDRDHLAALLELLDDAELVRGCDARVDVGLVETERRGDRTGRDGVVAGEHLQVDPGRARIRHGLGGGLSQRIVECEQAHEDELALDVVVVEPDVGMQVPPRDCEYAKALLGPCVRGRFELQARRIVERALDDQLRRALDERHPPLGPAQDDRHPLPHCIEGNLVHRELASAVREALLGCSLPDRRLDRIAYSSRGGEDSSLEHVTRRPPRRGRGRGEAEPVLGQRAGLVGADDGCLSGRLDR